MPEYNKLVRDGVPDIIRANGEIPFVRTLSDDEYELALIEKLAEEQKELAEADTTEQMMEELADVQEVVQALARHIGSAKKLEEIRARKAADRGDFSGRIFLERTDS